MSSASSPEITRLSDQRLRQALRKCEHAWERAVTTTSELSLALVAARSGRRIHRVGGHQILAVASKAAAHAGEGQSDIASAHRMIERFMELAGIEVTADTDDDYGDGQKPPKGG